MSKFSSRIDFEKICRFCGIVFCWCGSGDVNKTYSKKLFPSCPKPLFQSEAECDAIALKFFVTLMQIKPILTRRVLHLASFWKWGFWRFGNNFVPRFLSYSSKERTLGTRLARKWPSKFNVRNVFSLVVFVHALQPKLRASSAKGWHLETRVREFDSLSGYFLLW